MSRAILRMLGGLRLIDHAVAWARRHGDAGALYRAADAALYRAKLGGRNRTERAD